MNILLLRKSCHVMNGNVSLYKQMKGNKKMIKQVSLALAALGLSMSAYAAYPSDEVMPVAPPMVNVTIPQQIGSWTIGVEALYEEANNSPFHYAASQITTTATPETTVDRHTHQTDMDNDWGGHIDIGYNFAGDGRYVKLGYTHLTANDSEGTARPSGQILNGIGFGTVSAGVTPTVVTAINPNATNFPSGWNTADGKTEYEYDAVDLVFGQRFDFGQKVTLDAFGGLRYATLELEDSAAYRVSATGVATSERAFLDMTSEFQGLGPRAGMNAQVRLGSGFSIVGTFAGSLLVGEFEEHAHRQQDVVTVSTGVLASRTITNDRINDETRVVPELDARLGVNYTASFSPDTAVGIELGYEVVNYFDVNGNSQLTYADTAGHKNDFAMQGPYLRLQVDVA